MQRTLVKAAVTALAAALLVGCATGARQPMPTPTLYRLPGGQPVIDRAKQTPQSPDLDLLFITDRAPAIEPESTLP
jgi:esterase/lipase superfamily enzyme